MKNIKKLLSIVMVLTLVLSLGASAFAATVTIKDEGHEYTAYQIFKGENQAANEGAIGNLDWGSNIDKAKFISELQKITEFAELKADASANDVAEILSKITDDTTLHAVAAAAKAALTGDGQKLANGEAKDLGIGYYLIVDTTANLPDGQVQNDLVLEVTQNIEVTPKRDTPESQKKVKEKNDSTGAESGWQDGADYDIGDHVPFQLQGTLPTNYTSYEKYSVTFHDTQEKGLTFDGAETVTVTCGGVTYKYEEFATHGITVAAPAADSHSFDITIDVKTAFPAATDSSVITVEYTSTLNKDAVIGSTGNPNKMYMEYTSKFDGSGTTNTPEDEVTVFTYELEVEKVDGKTEPLDGAGFTLYKWDPAAKDGNGDYVAYQNGAEQMVKGVMDDGSDALEGVEPDKYVVDFKGLDAGKYKLVETTTPPGFNTAADIFFTVEATYDTDYDTNSGEGTDPKFGDLKVTDITPEGNKINADSAAGVLDTTVVNNSGVELPETGGIGTTIFYAVGAILVVGAVILLVTRKRMSGAEK